jgi:hypothetical protein
VYKIAKLARSDERRKERNRARADEKKKVAAFVKRYSKRHDINEHFGVRDD